MLANRSRDLDTAGAMHAQPRPRESLTDTSAGLDRRSSNRGDCGKRVAGGAHKNVKRAETHSLSKPRDVRRNLKWGVARVKPARVHHNLIFSNFVFSHVKPLFHFLTIFITNLKKGTPKKMPIFFRQLEAPTLKPIWGDSFCPEPKGK